MTECPGSEENYTSAMFGLRSLDYDFEDTKNWNNCTGLIIMNNYFEKLSAYTKKPKPHSKDGLVLLVSQFENGLPNGRASAQIGHAIDEDKFIGLGDEEQQMELGNSMIMPHTYIGNLKDGLPDGIGTLIYYQWVSPVPDKIDGIWSKGCIDWDEDVKYDSLMYSYTYKPSFLKGKYTFRIESFTEDADESETEIGRSIEEHLYSCVPGLGRGYQSTF